MATITATRRQLIASLLMSGAAQPVISSSPRSDWMDALVGDATPGAEQPPGKDDAPIPVTFPRDDGPHAAFIEWWYYTGHLFAETGDRYGFEFVVFKGERDGIPLGYASHFAVTDNPRSRFVYDERIAPIDPAAATPAAEAVGFDLRVGDWRMWGSDGNDRLVASMPGYALALTLAPEKPPALHDGDGYIDYGNGQASYYYSRTRLAVDGSIAIDATTLPVTGEAWMDHQWGDFNTFDDGGWDWFALQLDDGSDLMLYLITTADGTPRIVDGSLVAPDGTLTVLDQDDFSIAPTGTWTSRRTEITYPAGWTVTLPAEELELTVTPTLSDQELDTTASTGVIYWEGEVSVTGDRRGATVGGLGYVELTGYGSRDLPET